MTSCCRAWLSVSISLPLRSMSSTHTFFFARHRLAAALTNGGKCNMNVNSFLVVFFERQSPRQRTFAGACFFLLLSGSINMLGHAYILWYQRFILSSPSCIRVHVWTNQIARVKVLHSCNSTCFSQGNAVSLFQDLHRLAFSPCAWTGAHDSHVSIM